MQLMQWSCSSNLLPQLCMRVTSNTDGNREKMGANTHWKRIQQNVCGAWLPCEAVKLLQSVPLLLCHQFHILLC